MAGKGREMKISPVSQTNRVSMQNIDYEVYGYKIGNNGEEAQEFQVCYSLSDARAEARRQLQEGFEDIRIVKHSDEDAVAFWDVIDGKIVRTE